MSKQIFNDILNNQRIINSLQNMHDLIDSDSEQRLISPTAFIAGLENPYNPPELQLDSDELEGQEPLFGKMWKWSTDQGTKGSEKLQKKRLAGLKSREKKKKRLGFLQQSVKQLTSQIQQYDSEISKCKDRLVEAIKNSTNNSSEHSFTFTELEKTTKSDDPDLDRINMLLDLIQNRIGANGKQRQSKLQYNFKQIINSLFPASHRYFMHSAVYGKDIFHQGVISQTLIEGIPGNWTKQLYQQLALQQGQIDSIFKLKGLFVEKRRQTVTLIMKLKETKEQLKNQEDIFERALTNIREDMNPMQSAQLTLFGQRNKLRRQFSIFCDEFAQEYAPQKKVKTE